MKSRKFSEGRLPCPHGKELKMKAKISQPKMAVIIEIDYKGSYERFALTPDEFSEEFKYYIPRGMSKPTSEGSTFTLRPLVHAWYMLTEVGSLTWNEFFTERACGLPESDERSGNHAYISLDDTLSLKEDVEKLILGKEQI